MCCYVHLNCKSIVPAAKKRNHAGEIACQKTEPIEFKNLFLDFSKQSLLTFKCSTASECSSGSWKCCPFALGSESKVTAGGPSVCQTMVVFCRQHFMVTGTHQARPPWTIQQQCQQTDHLWNCGLLACSQETSSCKKVFKQLRKNLKIRCHFCIVPVCWLDAKLCVFQSLWCSVCGHSHNSCSCYWLWVHLASWQSRHLQCATHCGLSWDQDGCKKNIIPECLVINVLG